MLNSRIRGSIVASIPACHAGDPGSIPGRGASCVPRKSASSPFKEGFCGQGQGVFFSQTTLRLGDTTAQIKDRGKSGAGGKTGFQPKILLRFFGGPVFFQADVFSTFVGSKGTVGQRYTSELLPCTFLRAFFRVTLS